MAHLAQTEETRASIFQKSHLDDVPQADRQFYFWVSPKFILVVGGIVMIPVIIAWAQYFMFGLPNNVEYVRNAADPYGFPGWVRISHFVNFFFMLLLMRSGISILMDHPRLYFDRGCTPGKEVIKFTPIEVPKDRMWTAKDDCRYISPWIGLPGGRHTIGIARSWHFLTVVFFLLNGLIFMGLLLTTNQWQRLVPTSVSTFTGAWNVWVHYITLHFPTEPNGFYFFNPLQQLAYFAVVFLMAPISLVTGIAMSPAVDNRFPWYPKLFGGRQTARLIHFLMLLAFVGFIVVHVGLVILTGFNRNMNHIVFGTDVTNRFGVMVGTFALIGVALAYALINRIAWKRPEFAQDMHRRIITPFLSLTMNPLHPSERYSDKDISPFFWPNGKLPVTEDWLSLKENDFQDYKLKVTGLVEHPMEFSLQELQQMMDLKSIAHHHCIQGWSGIAKWEGISLGQILDKVKPLPNAKVISFVSFGEGFEGGLYYDTQTIENVRKPECMLALKMNGEPLPIAHGAPLRLRVENHLGYKMVKWIKELKIGESEQEFGLGFGGKNEDDEFFDLIPNI